MKAKDLDELVVMAKTIYGEARGEPEEGQLAVAWVIINRASKPSWWGHDIRSVCLKPYQFSCWDDEPVLATVGVSDKDFLQALALASLALSGDRPDPTSGATHYHASSIAPAWSKLLVHKATIGRHIFYA